MGIILSAMAAAGDAGVQSMNQNIQQNSALEMEARHQQNAMDMEQRRADLTEQKAKTLAEFNNKLAVDTANQQRTAQVDRINAAKQGIIEQQMSKTYGDYDAAVAGKPNNGTPLTAAQQAAIAASQSMVEREKANAKDTLMSDPRTAMRAAIQTGDISPKDAMLDTSKELIAQMRSENYKDRTEMSEKLANIRADAQRDSMEMRLEAARERKANGKVSASIATAGLASENKNITSTTSLINTLTKSLENFSGSRNAAQRTEIQSQIDDYKDDIKQSKAMKSLYLKELGFPDGPDSSSPKGLPPGAQQIGTAGGKPVYATPDGRKFTLG